MADRNIDQLCTKLVLIGNTQPSHLTVEGLIQLFVVERTRDGVVEGVI